MAWLDENEKGKKKITINEETCCEEMKEMERGAGGTQQERERDVIRE